MKKYFENYRGLPSVCWSAIILILIESCVIGICFFLSIYFVNNLHLSVAASGLIISSYGIGTVLGGIIGGVLSDLFPPKNVAAGNLMIEAIAILLLAKIKLPILLMADLFILGVVTYGFMTSINVWLLNHCENLADIKIKVVNISRVALNVGFGLSAIIISLLADYNFKNIFYLYGFVLCVSVVYLILFREIKEEKYILPKINALSEKIYFKRNNKVLILILLNVFFIGLVISQLSITYPVYIKEVFSDFGLQAVSILFILDTVLIAFLQVPLVNALSKYNHVLVVGCGAFLMGIGMLVLSLSSLFFLALVSCVLWATGEMLFIAMAQLICYEKSDKNKKGKSMGVYQMTYASSKIIGPLIGGYIFSSWGGVSLWYLCAMIGGICFIACIYCKNDI